MTDEMYKRLNEYLNTIFLELNKKSKNFIDKLYDINTVNYIINDKTTDLKIESRYIENNLTYNDVYLLTREILKSIAPKYLDEFDSLLASGKLDFSYENQYHGSYFELRDNKNGREVHKLINIDRKFNYDDVVTLIHEFFHYTNANDVGDALSDNRIFFTEFISIYFELVAQKYLIENKNVSIEELLPNYRIIDFLKANSSLFKYIVILLAYEKLGNINKNTIDELNNILNVKDTFFEKECVDLLKKLDKIKNNSFLDEVNCKLVDKIDSDYKYVIGTILAYYALENCKIDDILKLNEKIISPEYIEMSVEEILESIGIKYSIKVIEEAMEIIKGNIYVYESDKII